jgi:hypothetical protein
VVTTSTTPAEVTNVASDVLASMNARERLHADDSRGPQTVPVPVR